MTTTATTELHLSDLGYTIKGTGEPVRLDAPSGTIIDWTSTVTNVGSELALDVFVDLYPFFGFDPSTVSFEVTHGHVEGMTWRIGDLPPGEVATVVFSAALDADYRPVLG